VRLGSEKEKSLAVREPGSPYVRDGVLGLGP
jgi:hypothetical protein